MLLMEATLFSLFEQTRLEHVLLNKDEDGKTVKDFARFLAAYFANFPVICSRDIKRPLPNLFNLAGDYEQEDFYPIDRQRVSINLPSNYTPSLATQLLFECGLFLEAAFFVEQFNDVRSALMIRHLIDSSYSLNLLSDYCQQHFIIEFFSQLPQLIEEETADHVYPYLSKFVDVFVQISVAFHYDLLKQFMESLVSHIELLSGGFSEEIPEIIALPRPPIYALPSESIFERGSSKELRLWNELHYSIKTYLLILQRANLLSTILQQTTTWLCRLNFDFTEIPTLIELESTSIEETFLDQFQRVLLAVIRANSRDALCSAIRCQDSQNQIDYLTQRYIKLFPSTNKSSKGTLQKWAETGNQLDLDQVILFFQFIQENSHSTECYLPPLSEFVLEKWRSVVLMQAYQPSIRDHQLPVLRLDARVKIGDFDFKRLQFIAYSLPSFSLNDSSLIQISLHLHPIDFCVRRVQEHQFDEGSIKTSQQQMEEKEEDQQSLKQKIRATIRRLGRQTLTERAGSLHYLPHLLDDFNQHITIDERRSDIRFLATVRDLTSKRPLNSIKFSRSQSEKNIPFLTSSNLTGFQQPLRTEGDVGTELKAISARLARLRQKWTTAGGGSKDTGVKKRQPEIVMTSGISSSSSQLDIPDNFFANKQKRFRKRRPKVQTISTPSPIKHELEEEEASVETDTGRLDEPKPDRGRDEKRLNKTTETESDVSNPPPPILPPTTVPITSKSIERLDFSQLSDIDKKPEAVEGDWSEVSVLEKSHSTAAKITVVKTATKSVYPDWLTLLPLEDTTTSSRLLDLNCYRPKKDAKTPLNLQLPRKAKVYDSGFLEPEHDVQDGYYLPALSFDMSAEEIRELIEQCDK